ncbi:MAG: helix-turn-helix domain-containing protein [Patescibacteria group bacterium]
MGFTLRKIDQAGASFGAKLKALRRDRGLNYDQVAEATRLPRRVIEAFELDEFCSLPDSVYARHFLKTYVRFLGGDEAYFLDCFDHARGTCDFVDPLLLPRKKVRRAWFLVTPRIFRYVALGAIGFFILGYLGFEVQSIITPPTIELVTPNDGYATDKATIEVAGRVFEEVEVYIDGEQILLNQDGTFLAEVDLERGLNLIMVEAKKRYSRSSTLFRRVIFEKSDALSTHIR